MMDGPKKKAAPVLTATQQKKSIAGSTKVQKRKVVLNTLDSPLDLEWPRIGAEREEQVRVLLAEHLCAVRADNIVQTKEELSAMAKEERLEWRRKEKEKAKEAVMGSKSKMSDLLVGFRDVVRAAGKGQASVVFCEKTPDPPLLTRFLAPLCQNNGIPLFAIKDFSASVKNLLNVPRCLTMALKLSAKEASSPLNAFYQKNMEIYESCGLSVARPEIGSPTAVVDPDDGTKKADTPRHRVLPVTTNVERFYLKKSDLGFRFVPGRTKNPLLKETGDAAASIAADYIALSADDRPPQAVKTLRPHRIKQIRPNEKKKKRQKTE